MNNQALTIGYGIIALMMLFTSVIRMWSGSLLSSKRVMSFKIKSEYLTRDGPYKLVRNPIYFSDLFSLCCFALCLHPVGLIMPLLIFLHYLRLIKFEEMNLKSNHKQCYSEYLKTTPKIIPTLKSFREFKSEINNIYIIQDGFRHNALYLTFIPGFIVSAITQEFVYAIIIGLPGVIDWAIKHTIIGTSPTNIGENENV